MYIFSSVGASVFANQHGMRVNQRYEARMGFPGLAVRVRGVFPQFPLLATCIPFRDALHLLVGASCARDLYTLEF